MPPSSPAIFFILGRGRSGTTLLSRMLSANPKIAVAPEGFFLMNLRDKVRQRLVVPGADRGLLPRRADRGPDEQLGP